MQLFLSAFFKVNVKVGIVDKDYKEAACTAIGWGRFCTHWILLPSRIIYNGPISLTDEGKYTTGFYCWKEIL